ncbi:DUF3180 domain-containing protein [Glycomyces sp. L485]|uniref:DUF3180 domain-containing protein n=1 Tax=Glycomyces sp. L485 TaxID=2909235 RepID=UPI001F4A294F|nr:DUF3180 domain-containing protein [Glycomyces sp. L485]MCH7229480.1 DUF3180 domain-containing protein [Glycomyces sp. L485]
MSDDKHGPQPSLRPTTPSTIAVSALAGGALTLLLVARYYQRAPDLAWYNSAAILALAALIAWMAWNTKKTLNPNARTGSARADDRSETTAPTGTVRGPEHALQIARFAVLAKAASIGGAAFFGAYLGFTVWLAVQSDRLQAASDDLPGAVLGTVACAVLVTTALWLEHSCRIPPSQEDDDRSPG